MRFKLVVEYDGTAYVGWQLQRNGVSIQGTLESALERFLGQPVRVAAAGRTDAGVHATGQVVSFSVDRNLAPNVVHNALNALTPRDVVIRGVAVVDESFDVRRHAVARTYIYRIWNRRVSSPFWRRYAWHVIRPLDTQAMQEAAATLLGAHDFSCFRAAGCDAEHPLRYVIGSEIRRKEALITYRIEANSFLRHMVRGIAGTLVEVGAGERAANSIAHLLAQRDRTLAGMTAPAQGLCLTSVRYEEGGDAT